MHSRRAAQAVPEQQQREEARVHIHEPMASMKEEMMASEPAIESSIRETKITRETTSSARA